MEVELDSLEGFISVSIEPGLYRAGTSFTGLLGISRGDERVGLNTCNDRKGRRGGLFALLETLEVDLLLFDNKTLGGGCILVLGAGLTLPILLRNKARTLGQSYLNQTCLQTGPPILKPSYNTHKLTLSELFYNVAPELPAC